MIRLTSFWGFRRVKTAYLNATARWSVNACTPACNSSVIVNGNPIVVPYNTYADLIWVGIAELRINEKQGMLIINGGDASESYFANISFEAEAVRARVTWPAA